MRKQQRTKLLSIVGAATLFTALPASAAIQTWDFDSATQSFSSGTFGNTLTLNNGGLTLTVTAWSDTDEEGGPDNVQDAALHWAQSDALGVLNRSEVFYNDTGSPDHSTDSNRSGGDSDGDFDVLLLEFSEAVNLNGIDLKWAKDGGTYDQVDMSILAWDGSGSGDIGGDTWGSILDSNGGSYQAGMQYGDVGLSYYAVNGGNIESSRWLIGAYNPIFGAIGHGVNNDGFKLDWVQTSTSGGGTSEVPAPGTLALMVLGLAGLRTRMRK